MQLKVFKTLWGFTGTYAEAVKQAVSEGYNGIEGPVPESIEAAEELQELLLSNNLNYIAEIATTGTYVPDRSLSVNDHLDYLKNKLKYLKIIKPDFITCLGGCDAWPEPDSIRFLETAIEVVSENEIEISFETHRGRIFFNPWITERIVNKLPTIKLTCDFSHWSVVCEGLQDTEEKIIKSLVENAWHIHGRIGYDQGPQIPDPRTPLFKNNIKKYFEWWSWIWYEHYKQGRQVTTVTPEFGEDRYEYFDLNDGKALVDVVEINQWMASKIKEKYKLLN